MHGKVSRKEVSRFLLNFTLDFYITILVINNKFENLNINDSRKLMVACILEFEHNLIGHFCVFAT
jgi:hypothetical protein